MYHDEVGACNAARKCKDKGHPSRMTGARNGAPNKAARRPSSLPETKQHARTGRIFRSSPAPNVTQTAAASNKRQYTAHNQRVEQTRNEKFFIRYSSRMTRSNTCAYCQSGSFYHSQQSHTEPQHFAGKPEYDRRLARI